MPTDDGSKLVLKSLNFWFDNALIGEVYIALIETSALIAVSRRYRSLGHMLRGESNGVFSHDCLTRRGMGSDKYAIAHFKSIHSFLLEVVQRERVLQCVVSVCSRRPIT
jgi:hypothetical protein